MKPSRDADALAEALMSAAVKPIPLPAQKPQEKPLSSSMQLAGTSQDTEAVERPVKPAKVNADRAQITLRLLRDLLDDYTVEAGERTKNERRVVSAQEIMLEVLERGRPNKVEL